MNTNRNEIPARLDAAFWALKPFAEEVNRMLEGIFPVPNEGAAWAPSIEVVEGEKELVLRAELPGVDPKNVEVSVDGDVLILSGERKETAGDGRLRSEFRYGRFERRVRLAEGLDLTKVTAESADGVLTVRIPRVPAAEVRKIPIVRK